MSRLKAKTLRRQVGILATMEGRAEQSFEVSR